MSSDPLAFEISGQSYFYARTTGGHLTHIVDDHKQVSLCGHKPTFHRWAKGRGLRDCLKCRAKLEAMQEAERKTQPVCPGMEIKNRPQAEPCCDRAGEFDGGAGGEYPRDFHCPKNCPCHD